MMNKKKSQKDFLQLKPEDLYLTMFTITNLNLTKDEDSNMVFMSLKEAACSISLPSVS